MESSTSPLNTPSPIQKRMALLHSDTHDFIGDRVCQLVGTVQWYGNVTSSCMEDQKKKLWTVRYDNKDTEEKTINQLSVLKYSSIADVAVAVAVVLPDFF